MITLEDLAKEKELIDEALQAIPVDSAKALLVASGIRNQDEITAYKTKLAKISDDFSRFAGTSNDRVRMLYDFFHQTDHRIGSPDMLFPDGIDNYLDPDVHYIGNCWTVASLFYVLGEQNGLNVGLTYSMDHEHCRIRTLEPKVIIVDPIPKNSFDVERYADEKDVTLRMFLSLAYINSGDLVDTPEEKAMLCCTAIELSPEMAEGYSHLAAIHIGYKGNLPLAMQLCRRAIQLDDRPHHRVNLASAYHEAGRRDYAMFELVKIKQEHPDFQPADELMKRISKV